MTKRFLKKFFSCAQRPLSNAGVQRMLELVARLEKPPNVAELIDSVRCAGKNA